MGFLFALVVVFGVASFVGWNMWRKTTPAYRVMELRDAKGKTQARLDTLNPRHPAHEMLEKRIEFFDLLIKRIQDDELLATTYDLDRDLEKLLREEDYQ